jgi:hypothetical protein
MASTSLLIHSVWNVCHAQMASPTGGNLCWLLFLIPLTIFCLIININVVSSRCQGFLFYSQILFTPRALVFPVSFDNGALQVVTRWLAVIYGIWNLDFFRAIDLGICLVTDTLQTLALDYIIAVYPLLLIVMSYFLIVLYDRNVSAIVIIARPNLSSLFRENWNLRTS